MIVAVLSWTQPVPGSHGILLPDESEADVAELAAWLRSMWGNDFGHTVASVEAEGRGPSRLAFQDEGVRSAWSDLAHSVRYTTGEGLYDVDCPVFARRGIRRA